MGDRLGDGETGVSDFVVPLDFFILYCNAKAIAGMLVTRKLSYFIVTLLKNLRLSNIPPRIDFHQPYRGIARLFVLHSSKMNLK
jgi:hypothetical protein